MSHAGSQPATSLATGYSTSSSALGRTPRCSSTSERAICEYHRGTQFGRRAAKLANQGIILVDYDGDNDLDLALTGHLPIQDPIGPLAMYRNDGRGNFVDVTDELGIRFGDVGINGWSFGDLDGDGDLDAIVGFQTSIAGLLERRWRALSIPAVYSTRQLHRCARGFRPRWRFGFLHRWHRGHLCERRHPAASPRIRASDSWESVTTGAVPRSRISTATAIWTLRSRASAAPTLCSETHRNDSNWLRVRLFGPRGQAGAFGAKVYVYDSRHVDDPAHLRSYREARGATGYCSQNDPRAPLRCRGRPSLRSEGRVPGTGRSSSPRASTRRRSSSSTPPRLLHRSSGVSTFWPSSSG